MKKYLLSFLFITTCCFTNCNIEENAAPVDESKYPLHKNITATYFWVGEAATADNGYIPNSASAWDEHWIDHYGGEDDPVNRNGYHPAGFTPMENPFYFALPYNDLDENGIRKQDVLNYIYWADEKTWSDLESMCKNRWIKITRNNKTCYAQWEDTGPFVYDDKDYVFGSAEPMNTDNENAGLDVSPAVRDYLDLTGIDKVDWQFIDFSEVPDGPWKEIVTTRQIDWN